MDNLDDKLEVTSETTKDEIIGYAIRLYNIHKPDDLTKEEVIKYAGNTWHHSKRVHFYSDKLGISIDRCENQGKSETFHDLTGLGNKLEWEVMHGLAYAEKDTTEKKRIFEKALERHRIQMHHKMWNNHHSPEECLKYGAIDAVCSLLEPRPEQGGVHYWDEILKVISSCLSKEYQKEWMRWAVEEMKQVTPLFEDLKIMALSFLQGNKKNSEETKI